MGFISQKGSGLFTIILGIAIAFMTLWNSDKITGIQKYTGTLAFIMLFMFIFLLTIIDYYNEELKNEFYKEIEKRFK